MLSKKMEDALNGHINGEMYSAYLYMSMSAHSSSIGLKGFANWFMAQYHEEMFHTMRTYEYLLSQGGELRLMDIKKPPNGFTSPLDMFEKTLEHERSVTKRINDLLDLAIDEKDHASRIFLQWYVTEQVEEESTVGDIVARLRLIGDDPNALFVVDGELKGRAVTVPTDFSKGVQAQTSVAG